jgi:hypothetical protein
MSSNDELTINKKTYEVYHRDIEEEGKGTLIGKGKSLRDAIEIAEKFDEDSLFGVEYNIRFVGDKERIQE